MTKRRAAFRFVHCADLHLDSPFAGLTAVDEQIAAALRDATFRAFENVVDTAIGAGAELLVVAGDVYDGADRSLQAQLRFREAIARAAEAGIACCVVHGNHDPLDGWAIQLAMPDRSHRFENADQVEPFVLQRDGQPIAHVYGISYASRQVEENLASRFPRDHDAPFAIGLLHCNVGGNAEHDNYAPCSVEDLAAAKIDYWALGHIHARNMLKENSPAIVYSGNTQGRSVRELGPRGCYLVSVDESGRIDPQFVETDVVRWFEKAVDVAELANFDELLSVLFETREQVRSEASGRAAVVRLHVTGRGELHADLNKEETQNELLRQLREREPGRTDFVWTESLKEETRPAVDIEQRREVEDFIGDFLRAADAIRTDDDPAAAIREVLLSRPEHKTIANQLDGLSAADLAAILDAAEAMGLDYLLEESD